MTWQETHQRTRIMREVEAASLDMSGVLPWRESWAEYFGDRDGLVAALRARWERMCQAQLDPHQGDKVLHETTYRLRRTNAGILRILERHGALPTGTVRAPEMHPAEPVTPNLSWVMTPA